MIEVDYSIQGADDAFQRTLQTSEGVVLFRHLAKTDLFTRHIVEVAAQYYGSGTGLKVSRVNGMVRNICLPNGSRILFLNANRPETHRGLRPDWAAAI